MLDRFFACLLYISFLVCSSRCENVNYFFYTTVENGSVVVHGNESQLNTVGVSWMAQAFYNASQNLTGWDILELKSNPSLDDLDQAYHAGYIEGYTTRDQVYNLYYNNLDLLVSNKTSRGLKNIQQYFDINNKYIERMIRENVNDTYWHQIHLVYKQMEGMSDGYNNATKDPKEILTIRTIQLLNFLMDLGPLSNYTSGKKNMSISRIPDQFKFTPQHCSALIKVLPGNSDVFIGHDTWGEYTQMIRILKRYKLAFHLNPNSPDIIPGMSSTFSSYPGVVFSWDDFYVYDSGIVAMETTLDIYNTSLNKFIQPEGEVLEDARALIANRLANNGSSWRDWFKRGNSGTYNNQWMIIDLKHFRPGFDPSTGFLTVLEQIPGLIISKDQTNHILENGYWASYNTPFYPEMYKYSGRSLMAEYNSWYSYTDSPRAKIFKREEVKVTDLQSMLWLMRYNHYLTDPYSHCDVCDPQPNACNGIASRCDLNPLNGNYSLLSSVSPAAFGATDTKVTSFSLFSKGELVTIGGPTTSGVPPFSWSTTKILEVEKVRHRGQPDTFNFPPITTSWILPGPQPDSSTTTEPLKNTKPNLASISQPLAYLVYISIPLILLHYHL